MPLSTEMVGASTEPLTQRVDARWIMAYAAGLGDLNRHYVDTAAGAICAHPLFPVCLEWPVVLASRNLRGSELLDDAERARGVHAAHDLHVFRPIRAGDRLTTHATVIGLRRIRPGAAQLVRLDTVDASGAPVCRTYQLSILRDVDVVGGDFAMESAPAWPAIDPAARQTAECWAIPVAAGAAHVYTECARIWNPIHTDRAVALAAGLPDIILHGTATLALAISRLVDARLGGDPTRVKRLGGRFSSMVLMPATLSLEIVGDAPGRVWFRVLTEAGAVAFSDGFLEYGPV